MAKSIKFLTKKKVLFAEKGSDDFYMQVKEETQDWHKPAKTYWQQLYEKHSTFLDNDYTEKFPKECFSRLWELTQVDFIAQHQERGSKLIQMHGKTSKPDFAFNLHGESKFYLEAVSASPGSVPELNIPLEDVSGFARSTPIVENMARLCAAIREKAHTKYYGEKTCGYKCYIEENSGLIISVSMAKIPFHNQANNFYVDLSCIFGMSPMKFPLIPDLKGGYTMGNPYHDHQPTFNKTSKKQAAKPSPIKTDYFSNDEYNHVSAILLPHTGLTFFPDIENYVDYCNWKNCRNDYTLIHNPFAKVPLPTGFFNVVREVTATVTKDGISINIKENYGDNLK